MGQDHYSAQNFNKNELQNWCLQYVVGARTGLVTGMVWLSSTLGPVYYDGTNTRPLDAKYLTDASIPISGLATNPLDRANHTGTQLANTISNLKTTVTAYRLDEFAVPTAAVAFGNQKITGLGSGSAATDAVNLGQVQTLISQSIAGQTAIKNPVKTVFTSNITLSGVQNNDGYTSNSGERHLVVGQTDQTKNGIYTMLAGAWTRAVDADEPTEWTEGTEVLVLSGTANGGTIWRQVTSGTITPGTSNMNFTQTTKINTYTADNTTITLTGMVFALKISPSGGITTDANGVKVDATIVGRKFNISPAITGTGSTQIFDVVHNANNARPAGVQFYTSAGKPVDIEWTVKDANTITATFGTNSTPANGDVFAVSIVA